VSGVTSEFVIDDWYAVGGSVGLAPGNLMPATVLDSEMVVWRDSKGAVHAWHNKCIHRGLRMTLGFVDGDRLACRYHGWRYGAGGKCEVIPAHPDMTPPDDFRIPSYAACEHAGLIWASTGAAASPVDMNGLGEGLRFCRDLVIRQSPQQVAALARRAIFRPFGQDANDITYEYEQIAPAVIRIDARFGGQSASVALAIQPITGNRTGLHVLAGGETAAERRHYADWARRLRWFMENPDAATSSWRPFSD
jgi:nitrite reductase/ring-hydroxylating ferredoxin subunit